MKLTPYDKIEVERQPTMYAAPPPILEVKYPDYYILTMDDLVQEFIQKWDHIITSEINSHPVDSNCAFPEVFTIGEDGKIHKQVYLAQHVSERVRSWHPDISMIVGTVIETIKTKDETEQDLDLVMGSLWVDVAHMADIQIRSNVPVNSLGVALSNARRQVAALSVEFGKKLYQRLIEYGLYKNGYFPYHYVGWEGDCAIVALDETHR
jgi:hypothetical protein